MTGNRIVARIRSKPFHVQSRPNKRKRSIGDASSVIMSPEKKLTAADLSLVQDIISRTSSLTTNGSLLRSSLSSSNSSSSSPTGLNRIGADDSSMPVVDMCNLDSSRRLSSDDASDSEQGDEASPIPVQTAVIRNMSISESLSLSTSTLSPASSPALSPLSSPTSPRTANDCDISSRSESRRSISTDSLESASLSTFNALLSRSLSSSGKPFSLSNSGNEADNGDDPSVRGPEGNYIDITPLLVLPQKEAAKRLGISESMLCKRFKECTRRKWPYRYLRKIEKIISNGDLRKLDGVLQKEDKEYCLRPVKIRISSSESVMLDEVNDKKEMNQSPEVNVEEDIPDHILETLEMLKMHRPSVTKQSYESLPEASKKSMTSPILR